MVFDGHRDTYEDEFELEFASLMAGNPSGAGGSSGSSPPGAASGYLGSGMGSAGLGSSSSSSRIVTAGSGSRKGGLERRAGGWPAQAQDSDGVLTDEEPGEKEQLVSFKMLMKKGGTREEGRPRELLVPVSASVAAVVRRNADDEARERGEMKKLVLATHTKQQQREDGVGAFVQAPRNPQPYQNQFPSLHDISSDTTSFDLLGSSSSTRAARNRPGHHSGGGQHHMQQLDGSRKRT
ncbi:MAG: hypothetical protein WDW36_000835 [Sanguina aurantia]